MIQVKHVKQEKNNLIEEGKKKKKKGINEAIKCNEIINNSLKP